MNESIDEHLSVSPSSDLNGLTLTDCILPEEVLRIILSKVDAENLPSCRSVCRKWKDIVDSEIWRRVFGPSVYQRLIVNKNVPFFVYYRLYGKNPFDRNLIQNPSGKEGYSKWTVLMAIENWTDSWTIEDPPVGVPPVPNDEDNSDTCCFAAAFSWCSKEQIVDLQDVGILPITMDILKPIIHVSEWYLVSPERSSVYSLRVTLLNEHRRVLDYVHIVRCANQCQGSEWKKVGHKFINYKKGVRYIKFFHSGKEKHFWNGPHGTKMAKACVKLLI